MASSPEAAPPPPDDSSNSTTPSPPSPPPSSPSPPPPADKAPPPVEPPPPPPKEDKSPPPPSPSKPPSPPPPSNKSSPPPPPPSPPPPPQSPNTPSPRTPSPPPPPPPPPPHHSISPPHAPSHKTPPSDGSSDSDGMSSKVPMVVGVTAAVVVLLIAFIAVVVCCTKKKKRRRDHIPYYMDPPPMHKGSEQYYAAASQRANNWQNGSNSARDYHHSPKLPPQPGGPAWLSPPPPPPPPMLSSSDMGSANFSSGPRLPVLPPPSPSIALGFNKSTFTYDELSEATSAFSQANLLGQGGFGFVHKGVLPNGKEIAVKSLKSGSGQGEREFQAEVEIISRVHHRHLVSLVGYCIAEGQRMLVYEFVPNNTLEYHLHGADRPTMSWSNRINIALGAAKGLAYLHEDCHPRIIHRDIKAANILLDNNFEAMVADFGLAKLSSDTFTHVSTRVMGTFGYLAPEYASSGKLTEKSDVFSYGVMLLELITGRRPVDTTNSYMEDSLVDWARPLLTKSLNDGKYDELADPRLEGNFDHNDMRRMVACAAASIRHSAKRRPKMSQIVRALEGDVSLEDLNETTRPGSNSQFASPTMTTEYNTEVYKEDMKKFNKMVFVDEGSDSSQTGEFGVNNDNSTTTSSEATSSREMNFGRQRSGH